MTKVCAHCGVAPTVPEPEPPPSPTGTQPEPSEPKKCPNCGHDTEEITQPDEKGEGEEEGE